MARFRDPKRPKTPYDGYADIPYPDVAPRLMRAKDQGLVPFLGAGASRPFTPSSDTRAAALEAARIDSLAGQIGIRSDAARLFLEIALAIIQRLEAQTGPPPGRVYEAIRNSANAPSAGELAQAFAERSSYDFFLYARERIRGLTGRDDWDADALSRLLAALANLTGVGSPTPSLLDASSYSAYHKDPGDFWRDLHALFENKTTPTETQKLVADAAASYIQTNRNRAAADDYLIVTTNYDVLIETALDQAMAGGVPYYVLTVPKPALSSVELRFSPNLQTYLEMDAGDFAKITRSGFADEYDTPRSTDQFPGIQNRSRPMVIVYKIHGSLHPGASPKKDDVIITHEDYVAFLSVAQAVPMYIRSRLRAMRLMLLGYSFSDWNVRSLYRSITDYRVGRGKIAAGDYAVLLDPSPYETGFFDKNSIDIFDTTLDTFCARIRENV